MATRHIASAVILAASIAGCAEQPGAGEGSIADTQSVRSSDPALIVGTTWEWMGTQTPIEYIAAAEPHRYTMRLEEDGRARIRFDCNTGGGAYDIAEGVLAFGTLISTRMACPPDTQDAIFMRQLEAARIFFVEAGVLYLDLFADGGTMQFRTAPDN